MFNIFRKTPQVASVPQRSDRDKVQDAIAHAQSSLRNIEDSIRASSNQKTSLEQSLKPLKIRRIELDEAIEYAETAVEANPQNAKMAELLRMAKQELTDNLQEQKKIEEDLVKAQAEISRTQTMSVDLKVILEDLQSQVAALDTRHTSATAITNLHTVKENISNYERQVYVTEAVNELKTSVPS